MNTYVYLWYLAEFCLKWDVSDKNYRENQKTRFTFDNISSDNLTVYEAMRKKYDRTRLASDDNIRLIRRMRFVCLIT